VLIQFLIGFVLGILSSYLFYKIRNRPKPLSSISVKAPYKVKDTTTTSSSDHASVIYLDDQHDANIEKLRLDEAI
jgi:hypothetical protein